MKNAELRKLGLDELKHKLINEKKEYKKLKFSHSIAAIENPMKIYKSRKVVARISTIIKEKELSK